MNNWPCECSNCRQLIQHLDVTVELALSFLMFHTDPNINSSSPSSSETSPIVSYMDIFYCIKLSLFDSGIHHHRRHSIHHLHLLLLSVPLLLPFKQQHSPIPNLLPQHFYHLPVLLHYRTPQSSSLHNQINRNSFFGCVPRYEIEYLTWGGAICEGCRVPYWILLEYLYLVYSNYGTLYL